MNRKIAVLALSFIICAQALDNNTPRRLLERYYKNQNIHSDEKNFTIKNILLKQKIYTYTKKGKNEYEYHVILLTNDISIVVGRHKGDLMIYLSRGKQSWVYKKGLRIPLKISQKYNVAGNVSLFDVLTVRLDKYDVLTMETKGQEYRLELNAKSPEQPYQKLVVMVDTTSKDINKIGYMSSSGTLIKELYLRNYKKVSGVHRFPELTIKNRLFSLSDSASITYLGVEKMSFPASLFYPRAQALERFVNMYNEKIR